MPKVEATHPGAPIWLDLNTTDLEKAKAFYGALFGWELTDTGEEFGHYNIATLNGASIAGVMLKAPEMGEMPDSWTTYLAVDDADATAEAATAANGTVMFEPMAVGPLGTMAIIADPTGAAFGIWQPQEHHGYEIWGEHGAPAWHELMTLDFDAASAFYSSVFGVSVNTSESEVGPRYATFTIEGDDKAGLMDANGLMPEGVPSNWVVYFGVNDTDAAIEVALANGGSVLAPAADIDWGRFALLADPHGAAFAIISVGD